MNAELRDRVEALEEENRQLRRALSPVNRFPIHWRLSKTEEVVLSALLGSDTLTLEAFEALLADLETEPRTWIHRLRKKVPGIEIETWRGVGYRLTIESRGAIRAHAAGVA